MTYTLRALRGLALLAGLYLLAFALVGWFVFVIYALATTGVPRPLLVLPALLGVLVTYTVGSAIVASRRAGREPAEGHLVDEAEQPELWATVRSLAAEVQTRAPDEIRLIPQVNAAVTEVPRWMGLASGHRTMLIGVPLLLGLTRAQLLAVLTHELGHYGGRHTQLAVRTYRGGEALRLVLHELGADSVIGRVFTMYAGFYFRATRLVDRRQELEADLTAARVAGREATIAGLRETAPLSAAWRYFLTSYVRPAHDLGLRPTAVAEGFLDLLEDPERQRQLSWIRETGGSTRTLTYDTHPATAIRIQVLHGLPDDGRVDDGLPGFALLTDPDATMRAFFDEVFEDASGDLEPADWDRIGAALGQQVARKHASALVRVVANAPWRGGREATFDAVAAELRSGRAAELASRYTDGGSGAEQRELAAHLVGSLIGSALAERGLASYRLDWSGLGNLRDQNDVRLDVTALGTRAVRSSTGVDELVELATEIGIDLDAVLDFAEAEPVSGPNTVLGCVAPVQVGLRWVVLMPCTTGLAVLRLRGPAEHLALLGAGLRTGNARRVADLVLRVPLDEVLARPGAEFLPWDDIISAQLRERLLRSPALTCLLVDGTERTLKLVRQTDAHGDPWHPWDVLEHFLGSRYSVVGLAAGDRTGSQVGVPGP